MPETEFYLPYKSTNKEIENILKNKFTDDNLYLSIYYEDFIPENGMIKCSYEYYLDNDDVDILLSKLCDKYEIKNKDSLFSIYRLLNGENTHFDFSDKFNILYSCWDNIKDTEQAIFDYIYEHCLSKAKDEFLIAFKYWVDDDEKQEYYEYDEI